MANIFPGDTMTTATIMNALGLSRDLASAVVLAFSPNPPLDVLEKAASPATITTGRTDYEGISKLGLAARAGGKSSRRRVVFGCAGLVAGFALQIWALFA